MTIPDPIRRILLEGLQREGWPAPARARLSDHGGLTRGGITATNWGSWKQLGRPATEAELNAISEPDALDFYYERYVRLPRFDAITDEVLVALLVDWAFTSWFDDPTKALQRTLAARGLYEGEIDGEIGSATLAALASDRDPARTYREVCQERIRFYVHIAFDHDALAFLEANPTTQLHNLSGWVNRALTFVR